MSRVKHNALHTFAAGANIAKSTNGATSVPFIHPVQQGWKVVYEDFNGPSLYSADTADIWQFTAITAGTTAVSTGGVLFDNAADADNAGAALAHETATIIPAANTKKLYLEVSATVTAATMASTEFFLGVAADQTTTIANFVAADGLSWTVDDCFGIGKLDAETNVSAIMRQSDVEQTISFGSNPTTATRHTWSLYYDGATYHVYKDGALIGSSAKTVFNNDAAMCITAFMRSGAGETQNLLAQYILFAYEI